jgi:ribosomal protein S27AE
MAIQREAIRCPKCSAVMNRHAEKPSEPRTRAEDEMAARGAGFVIEETHQCPNCGAIVARRMAGS